MQSLIQTKIGPNQGGLVKVPLRAPWVVRYMSLTRVGDYRAAE